jgi:hypothetical protein
MTPASKKRIDAFISDFIRSEYVQNRTAEKDGDFINEPERSERCYAAAEFGADGKTHAEVIEDWREAFRCWMQYDRPHAHNFANHDRFEAAVEAHFDAVEAWHEANESLWNEIG